jgi:hypothetical protein
MIHRVFKDINLHELTECNRMAVKESHILTGSILFF